MTEAGVIAIRSVELDVADVKVAAAFYREVWALEQLVHDRDAHQFRATGPEHHVLTLRQAAKPGLRALQFAARDAAAVRSLQAKAQAAGVVIELPAAPLLPAAGGGYGFTLRSPDGLDVVVSSDVGRHADELRDRSRPKNLTHVVLNSADVAAQVAFFREVLGFRLSDTTARMVFMRCGADHHSLAIAKGEGLSLNHASFEMPDFDGLMRGCGRLVRAGHAIEWGVGRHGPGNNVFAYFIDTDGFAVEYTTGMEQIDEAEHVPGTADYWTNFPMRPCRWGLARKPSESIEHAFSGRLKAQGNTGQGKL